MGIVAIGGVLFMAPHVLRRVPFFRIRMIELAGNHYLSDAEVIRDLRLRPGASTWDGLDGVRRAALAIPGVVHASVSRRLPGALRVTLREATPIALAPVRDRLVLIDYRGHVLPFNPIQFPASLPVASGDPATAGVLARLRIEDLTLYDAVESARLERGDVVLDAGAHRFRVRPDAADDVFRGVAAVEQYLAQHHIDWREIDARYPGRVFVRRADA